MNYKNIKYKGLTLVELIITIAISAIVIVGIYGFLGFGNRTYKAGTLQYDLQSDTRILFERIFKDVKYARELEVLDNTWDYRTEKNYSYIYVSKDKKSIILKDEGMNTLITLLDGKENDFEYSLSFKPVDGSNSLLNMKISAKDKKKKYEINSSETILNIHCGFNKKIIASGESFKGIKYKKKSIIVVPDSSDDEYLKALSSWYDFEMYKGRTDANNKSEFMRIVILFNKNIKGLSYCSYKEKYTNKKESDEKSIVNKIGKEINGIEFKENKLEIRVPLDWINGELKKDENLITDEQFVKIGVEYYKNGKMPIRTFNLIIN